MTARKLEARRVIITGAAGAFGRATTEALRAGGARVAELGRVEKGDVIACDVTDDESVRTGVATAIDRLGGVDVLINNAGVGLPCDSGGRVSESVFRTVDVNLLGAWRVTAAALPELLKSADPRAVFVSSFLAYVSVPFASAYTVAKRGLCAYADCLRIEYGGRVKVTTVYPGYVRTPIHDAGRDAGVSLEGKVPAERVEDVVQTLLRVVGASRPPRDVGTSFFSGAAIRLGRMLPGAVDRVVGARHSFDVARGVYDAVPLAQHMLRADER